MKRSELLQKQISLIAESKSHMRQALEKFQAATSKHPDIEEKIADLLADLGYVQDQLNVA